MSKRKAKQLARKNGNAKAGDIGAVHPDWRVPVVREILRRPDAGPLYKWTVAAACFTLTMAAGLTCHYGYGVRIGQLFEWISPRQGAADAAAKANTEAARAKAQDEEKRRIAAEADAEAARTRAAADKERLAAEERRRADAEAAVEKARQHAEFEQKRRFEEDRRRADTDAAQKERIKQLSRRNGALANEASRSTADGRPHKDPGTLGGELENLEGRRTLLPPAGVTKGGAARWDNGLVLPKDSIFERLKKEGGGS